MPIRIVVSYHSVIVKIARFCAPISVLTPMTSSWWAWWDVETSKGDFLILMRRIRTKDANRPGVLVSITVSLAAIPATLKVPSTR